MQLDLFWTRVAKSEDACWTWNGTISRKGYGTLSVWSNGKNKILRAHRVAYQLAIGPIPEGMGLDHLCRNRRCVRPDHLEPVTTRTNNLRGVGVAPTNAAKTYCLRGHPFVPGNLAKYPLRSGERKCLACHREHEREYRIRRGEDPRPCKPAPPG